MVAQRLVARPAAGWFSVIVKLSDHLTPAHEKQFQALHCDIYRRLPFINSVSLRLPAANLRRLAMLPFVEHLSADGSVKKNDEFTVGSSGAAVALQQYNLTGTGIGVAVVDSGIRYGQDLNVAGTGATRILAAASFIPNDMNTDDACGHGTHVAGIIAGNGFLSSPAYNPRCYRTFYGIARAANLVNVRVLDANGQSTVSTVTAGIQWVVQHKAAYNIRVLNLSLGHPVADSYVNDPLCQAVEAAWKAGIVVVCAAGNAGRLNSAQSASADNEGWGTAYGSIQSPGNDPSVITVGATKSMDGNRADDHIATYSSRGPSRLDMVLKPDIIAPGNRIISLYSYNSKLYQYASSSSLGVPQQYYIHTCFTGNSTDYFELSGTSMASPVVAGAAALLLQANPKLSPDTVKARLMISADKWADPAGNADPCTYGAGYLNIPAALQSTAIATKSALSPALTRDSSGNVYINADRVIWGTTITDLRIIWGTRVIWGTNTISDSRIIWGTSVWSDRVIWGTNSSAADLSSTALFGE